MADFKSDKVDANSTYAYLPTGAVVMLGGPFSKYSDSYYTNLGLVPCDGRSLNGVSSIYSNLWAVIGTTFGGSGQSSFQVPNLTSVKKAVVANDSGTYAVGSTTNTSSHGHSTTLNYNSNNSSETHSHGGSVAIGNVLTSNGHQHNFAATNVTIGTNTNATNYATAGPGNQSALVPGSHNHGVAVSAFNTDSRGTEGSHSHGTAASGNTGNNTTTTTHAHSVSSVTATFPTNTFDGTAANPLETPYANVLYFIRI
jgi:microcystin-dependent protein